jgi:hypothetical protein
MTYGIPWDPGTREEGKELCQTCMHRQGIHLTKEGRNGTSMACQHETMAYMQNKEYTCYSRAHLPCFLSDLCCLYRLCVQALPLPGLQASVHGASHDALSHCALILSSWKAMLVPRSYPRRILLPESHPGKSIFLSDSATFG